MKELEESNKYINEQKEINKKRFPKQYADKLLMGAKEKFKEYENEKLKEVKELNKHRDMSRKQIKEKVNIKQVIQDALKKNTEKENKNDEFTEENPMNKKKQESKEETKEENNDKNDKQKQKEAYEKKQEELNKYNEMIKQENLKYDSFNNLYDQIISLTDGTKLIKNDPLRKSINQLLQTYGKKDIGASKTKEAMIKKLDQLKPEIEEIHQKRINESEEKKRKLEADKKVNRTPAKTKSMTIDDLRKNNNVNGIEIYETPKKASPKKSRRK
jgi:hypothetical protein